MELGLLIRQFEMGNGGMMVRSREMGFGNWMKVRKWVEMGMGRRKMD